MYKFLKIEDINSIDMKHSLEMSAVRRFHQPPHQDGVTGFQPSSLAEFRFNTTIRALHCSQEFIFDDFSRKSFGKLTLEFEDFLKSINHAFWIILYKNEFLGAIFLHSDQGFKAEIAGFVVPEFRGIRALRAAKMFIQKILDERPELIKLKAECYADNKKAQRFISTLGFEREGVLKSESMRGGQAVDSVVYSLIQPQAEKAL